MRVDVVACAMLFAAAATASAKPTKSPAKSGARPSATSRATVKPRRWNMERPADAGVTPAVRYAALDETACTAELAARKIAVTTEPATRGVRMPVRLDGALRGVIFRTNLKDAQRATTPWEIIDCRLALALDDFAAILAAHDIVDVRHYSVYRAPPKSWAADKVGMRHNGALAIDVARLIRRDGSYLDVDRDWHGAIGSKTCGEGAGPRPATSDAKELREILCTAVAQRLFHVTLTPNYNRPHKNHFHLELTEGWKSFLVH